jgi:diadenylate cyclase
MSEWLQTALQRPPIDWWDVLDVAIVAVFLYQLLLLIRGTRAVQMAVGAGFVTALFFLSRYLELEAVNWLIRNAAGYVVFAVIVLFQADIRRALAHFGRAPFLRWFSRQPDAEDAIEELVVAVANLSSHRIGALIVIERQIGLRNYIEGGIPLDALITYDLLATIFQTTSPLHDGAVIVQGDRIAAAACFRAALGLTEENDALAVVVSEETGIVSLAINGRLERELTPDTLRLRLGALLGVRRRRAAEPAADARSTAA